jgi:hypothetical protein
MPPDNPTPSLSGDLVPAVSQPDVSTAVVRLESARWISRTEQGLEWEDGSINLRVLEVLYGSRLRINDLLEVHASRLASSTVRVRNRSNYWNALHLNPNDILILACQPTSNPRVWSASAARQIPSAVAPEVSAIRRAYEIEEFSGAAPQRVKLLADALESDQDFLSRYALDYLARHADSQRDSAVDLLRAAILSPKITSDRRLNLALALSGHPFLLRGSKADRSNQAIVGTLATTLVSEPNSPARATWARLLASCVLREYSTDSHEADTIRRSLIRSPQAPPPARVASVLSEIFAQSVGEDREIVSKLLKAWQSVGQ